MGVYRDVVLELPDMADSVDELEELELNEVSFEPSMVDKADENDSVVPGASVGSTYGVSEFEEADAVVPASGSSPVGGYLVYASLSTAPVDSVSTLVYDTVLSLGLGWNVVDALETCSLVVGAFDELELTGSDVGLTIAPVSREVLELVRL